jgi:hypothetical protein
MTGAVIFEYEARGHLWRLEVAIYKGRTFANWRKWYRKAGSDWLPTREGVAMPLEVLSSLTAALMAYHGMKPPESLTQG